MPKLGIILHVERSEAASFRCQVIGFCFTYSPAVNFINQFTCFDLLALLAPCAKDFQEAHKVSVSEGVNLTFEIRGWL
jgi:hypothetical protein